MEEIKIDNFWRDNVIANVTETFDNWAMDEENLLEAREEAMEILIALAKREFPAEHQTESQIVGSEYLENQLLEVNFWDYEKFAVQGWFGEELKKLGEIVISDVYDFEAVWIRQQGGQKCVDDYVIKELYKDYLGRYYYRPVK